MINDRVKMIGWSETESDVKDDSMITGLQNWVTEVPFSV